MSADKLNEDKFDAALGQALRRSSVPVPADFTEKMLSQIREAEERRILARVILQERLALAGCIVLVVIAIIMVVFFPSVAGSFTEEVEAFVAKNTDTIKAVSCDWRFYTIVFVGTFGFAVYSLVDLLLDDG